MKDAKRIADKAGRFDEISLRSENRNITRPWDLSERLDRPYEPPSEVIRRVTAELEYLQDRERVLKVLEHIKRVYKK